MIRRSRVQIPPLELHGERPGVPDACCGRVGWNRPLAVLFLKTKQTDKGECMAKVLALRTSRADGTSHGGFKWPESGIVEAPDFSPRKICGYGLHALLWGEGSCGHLRW